MQILLDVRLLITDSQLIWQLSYWARNISQEQINQILRNNYLVYLLFDWTEFT